MYEFLGIINLMFSATIFTSAHIAIFAVIIACFLPELILQFSLLLLLFSGTPYYWFPYGIHFYAWLAQEIFVA